MNDNKPILTSGIAKGMPPLPISDFEQSQRDVVIGLPTAMQVFFAWEKLRLVYNGLLALIVILICGPAILVMPITVVLSAIVANLMFCAGPVGECYLFWLLGVPNIVARRVLFALGTTVSMGITVVFAEEAMRNLGAWP